MDTPQIFSSFPPLDSETDVAIGTHSGKFHCDEVLAIAMLLRLPAYRSACIVRTRDQSVLDQLDIVLDVGSVFDLKRLRFDHHQYGFNEYFDGDRNVAKLSSAGLIYKHFGRLLLNTWYCVSDIKAVEAVFRQCYINFIESVDAVDNGVAISEGSLRYKTSTDLSCRIARENPSWNEENSDIAECFRRALKIAGDELDCQIGYLIKSWLPARTVVEDCLAKRKQVDPTGQIVILEPCVPFQEHILQLEDQLAPILFVIFCDKSDSSWRVQCVKKQDAGFTNRLSLPERLRGLRGEELSTVAGIPGLIFVHASGFIGGGDSFEGVLALARMTLSQQ